ncbi:cytochrome P450 [Auricularia subglabra TFB-10046 SS5]|uniref:Cytochrome P450 n=1 Tax=Auricularia subglabra (strain TFB-10046 / SS5) TaxID=717982 RepID=J0LDL3_AURST|nr:cytochrome P450 [Auricularia subglabra TFB-10046 SS5]
MFGTVTVAAVGLLLARWLFRRERGDRIVLADAGPLSVPISSLWPPTSWLGSYWAHFIPFDRAGTTVIPCILPLTAQRFIYVADAAATRLILNDRHTFRKSTKQYEVFHFFGKNILGTEGDDWARHRSIARKSFGERNNALVWTEAVRILDEWLAPWDAEIAVRKQMAANVTDDLRHITLFVIASAGFGLKFSRAAVGQRRAGFCMTFNEALFKAIETMFLRVAAPRFLYALPIPALKRSDMAFVELERYVRHMIVEARADGKTLSMSGESADLFKRLIEANDADDAQGARLTDDELVSNICVYLLAGHETSSHTLTFALALLTIHPEVQEKLHSEAKRAWPDLESETWKSSSIADFGKLEYTLAVFRETLRLFPAGVRVPRWSTSATTLPCETRNSAGQWEPGCVSVAPGTACLLDITAVHMSPLYWGADAACFRPERFIDTPDRQWPRDAWVPFIAGHHVCLGQRFATVESVCILARMLRKYRLTPTPEIAKLPRSEQWRWLTKWTMAITATPGPVHLVLEHRDD